MLYIGARISIRFIAYFNPFNYLRPIVHDMNM